MDSESNVNDEPLAPEEISRKLRERTRIIISPIDLSLEKAEIIKAEQLKWLNFCETPLKVEMRNCGDAMKILGCWPYEMRPKLSGGPLDGVYVFSQVHFHCQNDIRNTHTINGKSNPLEMHAVFYKSSYKNQAEALVKDDGVVILVYFFKVKQQTTSVTSLWWLTDHLGRMTSSKTKLPPAPLGTLMTPFTQDYLAYWGALPCTCHRVLWLLSRTPLWITSKELKKFDGFYCNPEDNVNKETNNVREARDIFLINPSNESHDVLLSDPIDLCQISVPRKKYLNKSKKNVRACKGSHELLVVPNTDVSGDGHTLQEKSTLKQDFNLKTEPHPSGIDGQSLCSSYNNCRGRESVDNLKYKVINTNKSEEDKVTNVCEINTEKESMKNLKQGTLSEFCMNEKELAKKLLDGELEAVNSTKMSLDGESKETKLTAESKENMKEPITTKPMQVVVNLAEEKVLTGESKLVLNDQENLLSKQGNIGISNKLISKYCADLKENTQSETPVFKSLVREEKETKIKSKVPVVKFTPWKPHEGLKSSLTPLFSGKNHQPPQKPNDIPGTGVKVTSHIPRFHQKPINKTEHTQDQNDLGGKGDYPPKTYNRRRVQRNTINKEIPSSIQAEKLSH